MSTASLTAPWLPAATLTPGRQAQLWMVAFVALWAIVEVLADGVLRAYSPYQVVWTRYGVHLALMLAVWGWRQPGTLLRTRRPVHQLARSMLMVGMPASWIVAMDRGVDPRTVLAVFWVSPILVLAFAAAALGERAPRSLWLISLAAGGAAAAASMGRLPQPWTLLVFPAGMAVTFSLYVVMTRPLRVEPTRVNLFYTAFGVWLVLLPFMPGLWKTPSMSDGIVMGLVGVLGLVTLFALDRAAACAPVSLSAPFIWLQIGITALLVAGLGHGGPARRVMAALLIVVAAAVYLYLREPQLVVAEKEPGR